VESVGGPSFDRRRFMTSVDAVGLAAGMLTTVAFVPQVMKTWRERSTGDLSLAMYLAFCCGVLLWLVYGLMLDAWPVVLANGATLVLAGTVLAIKLRHVAAAKKTPPSAVSGRGRDVKE